MTLSRDDVEFLALLVHKGLLSEDQARTVFAAAPDDLDAAVVAQGWFSAEAFARLRRTRGGEVPELSRYEVHEELGRGGTARVFRATDRTDRRTVALKVLRPELVGNATAFERFVAEAQLLIRLRHEHIVKGYRVAREKDQVYLAMELIPGEPALEPLLRGQVFGEDDALHIVLQVARALDYLHGEGLVHKDIKPGNILWTPQRRAVLIDLGFAGGRSGAATESDTTLGTAQYISPEQARGRGDLDSRADIYSLGATLYHLAVGELPFSGTDNEEILRKQVMESLSIEKIRQRNLSPHLHYFIEKMMAKEREIRYQTPAELIADMESLLQGRAALATPTPPPPPKRRPPPPAPRRW